MTSNNFIMIFNHIITLKFYLIIIKVKIRDFRRNLDKYLTNIFHVNSPFH